MTISIKLYAFPNHMTVAYVCQGHTRIYVRFVGIQFTLQNDIADHDTIKADWKWIQTGSVNLH